MQLTQLETFLAVAREQNYSRAAEKLYISQPSLTARVQALEKELGNTLFIRCGRTTRLSAVGMKLLPYVEQGLSLIKEGCQAISDASRPATSMAVASTPIIASYCLPHLLKYLQANTNIEVSLRTAISNEVVHLVETGAVDAGFANADYVKLHRHVSRVSIVEDTMILVASPCHPLSKQGSVSRRALRELPIIAYTRESASWRPFEALLTSPAVPHPNIILELDNFETIKSIVKQSVYVAFVPMMALWKELREGTLTEIKICPPVHFTRSISLFYLRSRGEEYGIRTMVGALKSYLDTHAFIAGATSAAGGGDPGQDQTHEQGYSPTV